MFSPVMRKAASTAVSSANQIAGADARMQGASDRLSASLSRQAQAHKMAKLSASGVGAQMKAMINPIMATVAAATSAAYAFKKLVGDAADAGDKIYDLSRRMGTSTEFMSEMQYVAEQNGASLEQVGKAVQMVSKNAATNSAEFRKWGVDVRDAAGQMKSAEDLFYSAISTINGLGTESEKTAAAMDIFGRSGAEMLQVIKLGSDGIDEARQRAVDLGASLDSASAVAANQFNNKLTELNQTVGYLGRELAIELLPTIETFVRATIDAVRWVKEHWQAAKNLLSVFDPLVALIRYNVDALEWLAGKSEHAKNQAEAHARAQKQLEDQMRNTNDAARLQAGVLAKLADLEKRDQERRRARIEGLKMEAAEREKVARANERAAQSYIDKEREQAEEHKKARARRQAVAMRMDAADRTQIEELAAWRDEKSAEALERQKADAEQLRAAWSQASSGMGAAMGQAFSNMILDSKNAHKHLLSGMVDAAASAIQVYAVQAAAGASAATAILSPFAMAAASAAALGLVRGLISMLPSFSHGGIVPGVDTGRDSQIIAARPGERVLTNEQTDLFERMINALERGAGAGGVHIHNSMSFPPTSGQTARQLRDVRKFERRYARLGMAY